MIPEIENDIINLITLLYPNNGPKKIKEVVDKHYPDNILSYSTYYQ